MMKKVIFAMAILLAMSVTGCEQMKSMSGKMKFWDKKEMSDTVDVTVTNITAGSFLTPILAVGHGDRESGMFEYGKPASEELQALAEGGNIEPIAGTFDAETSEIIKNPKGGLLGPGESTTFSISSSATRLSVITMILPTNDGFVAADNIVIREGVQELYAIDAGTEANDEQVTGGGAPNTPGIPADPGGNSNNDATGISSASAEGKVDRHPGISGAEGSALNPEIHGWEGAVATIQIGM